MSDRSARGVRGPTPVVEGLGTAVPGEGFLQSAIRAKAEEVFAALAPDLLERLAVFETVGIRKRHFVRPLDWYLEPHGWADRMAAFEESGLALVEEAARAALADARVGPEAVDGVVLVTTTGIATPSLDARLVERIGLRPDVRRVPVWGLGCAGGVAGLSLASRLAQAEPDSRWLLVAVETCSLAFNMNDFSVRAFVAATLFSDGAAAAVVRGGGLEGRRIAAFRGGASHTWPGTRDVMGWDVLDEGLRVVFSRRIPDIVARDLGPVVDRFLKGSDLRAPPDRLVLHPGGTKVLDAYEQALGRPAADLETSRATLREYGNVSSPTVLFVLRESTRRRALAPGETALAGALGPGFTAELALLEG